MARSNRGRRRRAPSKDRLYIIIGVTLVTAVCAVVATALILRPDQVELDSATLCPTDGPGSVTLILIDRTDRFGTVTKADIEVQLQNRLDATTAHEEIVLFAVNDTDTAVLAPIIQLCNPGAPRNVDPLIASKAIVERNWQQRFMEPMSGVLRELLVEERASRSPIMESIQSVSVTHFGTSSRRAIPRQLIIISDLLQNSSAWSLYTDPPDYERFKSSFSSRGLNPDLRDVEIEMWLIQRNSRRQADQLAVIDFWSDWISEHGGRVKRVLKLSGLN